jgi:hypothetical protein
MSELDKVPFGETVGAAVMVQWLTTQIKQGLTFITTAFESCYMRASDLMFTAMLINSSVEQTRTFLVMTHSVLKGEKADNSRMQSASNSFSRSTTAANARGDW